MSTEARARPLRADAQRNREKLLAAAVQLFAQAGPEVSLEAIAKRAGVGIGTLYRHFHTRDELVEEAYRNEVGRLCDAAGELLSAREPEQALGEWMERFVTYVAAKRGMAGALQSVVASNASLYADTRGQIVSAIATLLDAGAAAGSIREDVDAEDVLRAMNAIWLVTDAADWRQRARRLLTLLMDGLRHRA